MKNYLKSVVFCKEAGSLERLPWGQGEEELRKLVVAQWEEWAKELPEAGQEGVLYITDKEECLNALKERGLPVAAWLHEGNRGQDFSATAYVIENPEEVEPAYYEKIYRRERGIPWEILETERCLVREMVPEDAKAFGAIYREPAVQKYMKDFHGDVEGERRYIEEYQHQYRFCEYGVWSVVLKETGEVIGRVGFSEMVEEDSAGYDRIQFGYVIGVPWQGIGLATEVCKAVLDYAETEWGFRRIYLKIEEGNEASLRFAERLKLHRPEIFLA